MNHPGMNGIKGAKVRFESDPNNPLAPPRRVIEKMGFWERTFGPKDDPMTKYYASPLQPTPSMSGTGIFAQPRSLPPIFAPIPPAAIASLPSATLRPTPFPYNFKYLPRAERHAWEKQRKEELRFFKALEKEHRAAMKAEEARKEREFSILRQKEKEDMKSRKSAMKLEKKLGYRPMPQYIPPTSRPLPGHTAQQPSPMAVGPGPGPPTSWMLLPTMEQFGVRRPFDAPGKPQAVDIGGTEWPMMSRTMTHALKDMGREERVHLDQAGHTWSPGWYRD